MVHASAMANPQPDPYARVVHRFSTASKLDAAGNMLSWDAQTHMPAGGAWARGEQMAALTEVSADLIGSRAADEELGEAEAMANALAADERADLAEMRHNHVHASAVPKELLAAKSRASQALQAVWRARQARERLGGVRARLHRGARPHPRDRPGQGRGAGDHALRRPDRRVRPRRRRGDDRPDLRRAGGLPARRHRRGARAPGGAGRRRSRSAAVPIEQQAALSHQLAVAIGHDPDHFRIDPAPHPFSVPHSPGDVRFTTRYDVENLHVRRRRHAARGRACDVRVQPATRLRLPPRRHGARDDGAREPVAVAGDDVRPQPGVPRLAGAEDGRRVRRRRRCALLARQRARTPGAGSTTASSASRPTSSPIRCT